ncbi:permease [Hoyosella rhizosphaerae]|uniref:Probable membrane transporter protein n=2 Tax=Hoyosella rhizosphaerae TaxID=1755582 RepID=A0A916U1Y6_9ACTN|nr:permease [Hoyosella rhizosphaerae]
MLWVLGGFAVFIGSVLQRVAGTGVGLIVAPILVVALGPSQGVVVANVAACVAGFVLFLSVRKQVDWSRFGRFMPTTILGSIAASALILVLPPAWLQIGIGVVVLCALALSVAMPRLPHRDGRIVLAVTGVVAGFLNTAAGVASPAFVIYARLARWEPKAFVATMQPAFAALGAISVTVKAISGVDFGPVASIPVLAGIVGLATLGLLLGAKIAAHVNGTTVRRLALVLAAVGALAVVIRGISVL